MFCWVSCPRVPPCLLCSPALFAHPLSMSTACLSVSPTGDQHKISWRKLKFDLPCLPFTSSPPNFLPIKHKPGGNDELHQSSGGWQQCSSALCGEARWLAMTQIPLSRVSRVFPGCITVWYVTCDVWRDSLLCWGVTSWDSADWFVRAERSHAELRVMDLRYPADADYNPHLHLHYHYTIEQTFCPCLKSVISFF